MPVRPRSILARTVAVAAVAALAGCSAGGPGGDPVPAPHPSTPEATVKPHLTPVPQEPPRATPGALPLGPVDAVVANRPDVRAAVAAEAERRGVPTDRVELAGYADVTWPDGSIGCPEPGMQYTQALVPGHQLVLAVDGQLASYHAASGAPFAYCARPTRALPEGAGGSDR